MHLLQKQGNRVSNLLMRLHILKGSVLDNFLIAALQEKWMDWGNFNIISLLDRKVRDVCRFLPLKDRCKIVFFCIRSNDLTENEPKKLAYVPDRLGTSLLSRVKGVRIVLTYKNK